MEKERVVQQFAEKTQLTSASDVVVLRQEALEELAGHRRLAWCYGAARVSNSTGHGNLTASLFAFAVGVVLLHQCSELPGRLWIFLLALCASALPWRQCRIPAAFCLGVLWACWQASAALANRLPAALEGVDLTVTGRVVAFETDGPRYSRLVLRPTSVDGAADWQPRRLRLGWYGEPPAMAAGDTWRLRVRLKRPNGLMNPGGFDYERWLFAQGFDAVGYVRDPAAAQRLAEGWHLNRLRRQISGTVASRLEAYPAQGIIVALVVGDRSWISDRQWDVLRQTGTAHLVAISGLHVGLVALLATLAAMRAWRLSAAACRRWPARLPGVVAGMAAAVVYAALAGFTLPTQRALVMLLVPALALLARRRVGPWHAFGIALVAVLLWDPFAPLSAGFWLSFGAVAVLLAASLDRAPTGWLRQTVGAQVAVAVGLLPVSVLWLQTAAWASPAANLWAVPLVGFVVVPLALAGTGLSAVAPAAGELVLQVAAHTMGAALAVLEQIADYAPAGDAAGMPAWAALSALAATGLLLFPLPFGIRWLAIPLLAPVVLALPAGQPADEALRLTLLDSGQGLSVVVESGGEAMVYDTGAAAGGFDIGELALVPYLESRGYRKVRWLIVSHDDLDHSGGTAALSRAMPLVETRVGEPVAELAETTRCTAGMGFEWNGVSGEFIWPPDGLRTGNEASCVLRLEAAGIVVLLTGDIGTATERVLVRSHRDALPADILLVPHHGSANSSTADFVDAVAPRYALVSAGYRNRWDFPRQEVVDRYRAAGARVLTTSEEGAITISVRDDGSLTVESCRRTHGRYFHRRPDL